MLCPQCSQDNAADARFCTSCGVELEAARVAGRGRHWYSRKRTIIPVAVVLVFVALLPWLVPSCLSAKGEAEEVVRAFLEAATAGRAEVALEYVSSSYAYQDEVVESIRVGQWKGYADISVIGFEIDYSTEGSSVYLEGFVLHTDGSRTPFEVTLVKEGDSWKIVAMSF